MRHIAAAAMAVILCIGCSQPSAEEMFKKGEEAQKADQYDSAVALYQELIAAYPDSARTPEAWYAIGTIYQNHKRSYHQAISTYRQLVEKFPAHATSSNAAFLIGFIYNNDLKNIDSARIAYEDFLKKYPSNPLVESVQFELRTLGKDAGEILKEQAHMAQKEKQGTKKRAERSERSRSLE